jgi:hypothetical protein
VRFIRGQPHIRGIEFHWGRVKTMSTAPPSRSEPASSTGILAEFGLKYRTPNVMDFSAIMLGRSVLPMRTFTHCVKHYLPLSDSAAMLPEWPTGRSDPGRSNQRKMTGSALCRKWPALAFAPAAAVPMASHVAFLGDRVKTI